MCYNINANPENKTQSPECNLVHPQYVYILYISTFYLLETTLEHTELVVYYNIFSSNTNFHSPGKQYQFIASIPFHIS